MSEFNLEKQEVEVEVVVKEYKLSNATTENLRESLINENGDFEGFSGGIEILESDLDNLVPYYIIPKQEDEDGVIPDKPMFKDIFAYRERGGRYFLMICKRNSEKSWNSSVGVSDDMVRGLYKYFDNSANWYTKSDIVSLIKSIEVEDAEEI